MKTEKIRMDYKGVPYWITVIGNYRSPYDASILFLDFPFPKGDCGYRYYTHCEDADGNEYVVRWVPTQRWADSDRWDELENRRKHPRALATMMGDDDAEQQAEMKEIAARAGETIDTYEPLDRGDESIACDWDHPESVVPVS